LILAVDVPTPYVQGGLRTRISKKGTPVKSGYFSDIGLFIVKAVADRPRHRHVAYHNKHWWRAL